MTRLPPALSDSFIFGFAGYSGAGKTTLAEKIIAKAAKAGVRVATLKHAHHDFEADIEGKDSWRHRKAGAEQVIVASSNRIAHFTEQTKPERPKLFDLLARLDSCDWVIVEGFKEEPIAKIELFNPELNDTPLYLQDENIIAIISQTDLDNCPLPSFNRDDVEAIFAFLTSYARDRGTHR